jgi:hypothetical protein
VKFRAGGMEFNANVTDATESPSPQTGDPLRTLTIQFRAQKESIHEQAVEQAQLRQSGGLYSLDDADQPILEWRVRDSTFSYVGSAPWGINHHVWRLEQVERLACELLRVGAIELEPYDYVEEAREGGVVRLAARALISAADLASLSKVTGPIEVTRVGISDTPRRMRVDYVWGERPEAPAVVIACCDVAEPRITVAGFERYDSTAELLELLRESGAITDDLLQKRHAARRVANVDGWPLMK